MREGVRVYISLAVYDYYNSSRHRRIQHTCSSLEQAKHLVHRLETLMDGHTGRWLDRNHGVYGFIERI